MRLSTKIQMLLAIRALADSNRYDSDIDDDEYDEDEDCEEDDDDDGNDEERLDDEGLCSDKDDRPEEEKDDDSEAAEDESPGENNDGVQSPSVPSPIHNLPDEDVDVHSLGSSLCSLASTPPSVPSSSSPSAFRSIAFDVLAPAPCAVHGDGCPCDSAIAHAALVTTTVPLHLTSKEQRDGGPSDRIHRRILTALNSPAATAQPSRAPCSPAPCSSSQAGPAEKENRLQPPLSPPHRQPSSTLQLSPSSAFSWIAATSASSSKRRKTAHASSLASLAFAGMQAEARVRSGRRMPR